MVNTIVDGAFRQTNLTNESSEYLAKREALRLAEIELMRQRERVAELRRHLPQGATIQDYQFEEGPHDFNVGDAPLHTVRLSELFTKPNRSLIIYHFMATVDSEQQKTAPSHILADFVGKTPEGIEVGVILHAREGAISELEVYAMPDVTGPFSLPSIESLKQL
jgi:predicted dithiol-disulfide oxidoreductase (DUF899 family)